MTSCGMTRDAGCAVPLVATDIAVLAVGLRLAMLVAMSAGCHLKTACILMAFAAGELRVRTGVDVEGVRERGA